MLWWLAQNSATCAALALFLLLVTRWARISPALRHALWFVVLLKLVTPTIISWPWQVPIGETAEVRPEATDEECLASPSRATLVIWPEVYLDEPISQPAVADVLSPEPSEPAWNLPRIDPGAAGVTIWLAGGLLLLSAQSARVFRFRSTMRHSKSAPPWLQQLVDRHAAQMGVRSPVTRVVPGLSSPCIWSLGRPWLLCPGSLLEGLSISEWRSVIIHELAHIRRRDHWTAWLLLATGWVYWWNPLYWLVRRQLHTAAELACDAWVVGALPEARRVYAEALLQVTQMASHTRVPVPALGMSGARRIFERRLTMIMRDRVPCRLSWTALGAVLLLALAAAPGWSRVDDEPKKPKKEAVYAVQVTPAAEPEAAEARPFIVLYDDQKSEDPATGDDREKRLQALEKQVQALLKEVRALRGGQVESHDQVYKLRVAPKAATITVRPVPAADAAPALAPALVPNPPVVVYSVDATPRLAVPANSAPPRVAPPDAPTAVVVPVSPPVNARFTIHSAKPPEVESEDVIVNKYEDIVVKKYKLPFEKANKLAEFLTDNVRGIKTKVDKDGLTVHSTQQAANAINALVKLMAEQGK